MVIFSKHISETLQHQVCIVDQRTSVRVSLRLYEQVCACSQRGRQNTYSPRNIMSYFIDNRCATHFFFILLVAPPMWFADPRKYAAPGVCPGRPCLKPPLVLYHKQQQCTHGQELITTDYNNRPNNTIINGYNIDRITHSHRCLAKNFDLTNLWSFSVRNFIRCRVCSGVPG